MYNSQGSITILDIIHNNTNGKQIINFIKLLVFGRHFLEHAVDMLRTARKVCLNAHLIELVRNSVHNRIDILLTFGTLFVHQVRNTVILLRIQITEGDVLHFPFDRRDPQTVRNRTENFQRLI
ncbi:hypothetical protein D3C74_328910 [compost metagenome]